MATQHNIQIQVHLDENKIPERITWKTDSTELEDSRAIMLHFWSRRERNALRLDLWTKDMPIDEMGKFFFQNFLSMSETYKRAIPQSKLYEDMVHFAQDFFRKFQAELVDIAKDKKDN